MAGKSMSPSCEICVLAGGLSSRMGSDKAGGADWWKNHALAHPASGGTAGVAIPGDS